MDINSFNDFLEVPSSTLQIMDLTANSPVYFSLVIPTYKESDNIHRLIQILTDTLDKLIPGDYELIVVDDDSPDLTWQLAQSLTGQYPHLRVMRRQKEKGLSSAVIRGWQVARGSILGVIDGDLQHPPEVLTQLLTKIAEGADLAVGSRHVDGGGVSSWSLVRRFLSRGAQILGLVILPEVVGKVSDPMSGYFIVRRYCLVGVTLNPVGYKILLEVIGRSNINGISEVGYVFCERKGGESKVTWRQYLEYMHHLIRLRCTRGTGGWLSRLFRFPVDRFLRFALVGLSGVFVDMAILYLLSDPNTLDLPLTRSKLIAGEIAVLNNFLWNDTWTFGDVSKNQGALSQRVKRFLKFNIICLAGLFLNVVVLNLVFNLILPNRYIANLIAIAIATIWNFWVNLKLSWRVTDVK